jgi:hypothetical protein
MRDMPPYLEHDWECYSVASHISPLLRFFFRRTAEPVDYCHKSDHSSDTEQEIGNDSYQMENCFKLRIVSYRRKSEK